MHEGGSGGGSGIPNAATLPSIKTAKDGYKDGEISMFNKDGVVRAHICAHTAKVSG